MKAKLTTQQKEKLQFLTSRLERFYGQTGICKVSVPLAFEIQPLPDRSVMIVASNRPNVTPLESEYEYYAYVSPRGRVTQFDGNCLL